MKKIISIIAALALFPASYSAAAQPDRGDRVMLIVEVEGGAVLESPKATRMGVKLFSETDDAKKAEEEALNMQKAVQSEIKKRIDSAAEAQYTYTYTFNGFATEAYEGDTDKIRALPGVKNVYTAIEYTAPDPPPDDAYIENGGRMMNIDYMRGLGVSGRGEVIAIVDDGFDTAHEYYAGAIDGARLSRSDIESILDNNDMSAFDINNKRVTANKVYKNEKIPYAFDYYTKTSDTFDSANTHGTHVAGIAAGNNGHDPDGNAFVGAAPDAQLLLMACTKLYNYALIAAIDDSVKLGADVINASWGSDYTEESYELQKSIETAVNAGVVFCAAASNSSRGYQQKPVRPENIDYSTQGNPPCFTASTSVASAESNESWSFYRLMYIGETPIHFSEENEDAGFAGRFLKETEYVYCKTANAEDFKDKEVKGKIALIDRDSETTFAQKVENARNAGAAGVLFINTEDDIPIGINKASLGNMPSAAVAAKDGDILRNAKVKKLRAEETDLYEYINNENAGMSGFSSWGTNSSLELKPEITAPGGKIYSSVSDNRYENKSGTSMASPYLAGCAALMKQYFKENADKYGLDENESLSGFIENMLMSTAKVMYQNKNIPYSPRLQGAGLADLKAAAQSPAALIGDVKDGIEKSKLSLKEIGDSFELKFKARNYTSEPVVYDNIKITVITDDTDKDGYIGDMRELPLKAAEMPESVFVSANSEEEITVRVTLDSEAARENMEVFTNGFFVDGYVFLSRNDHSVPEISIPFTGFYGGWDKAPVLDKPYYDEDSLIKQTYITSYTKRTASGGQSAASEVHILGKNLYADENSDDYAEYNSGLFAGISPNGDGECDIPVVIITPLRRMGKTIVKLLDGNDNVIEEKIDKDADGSVYYAEKFAQTYLYVDQSITDELDDGDYTMRITTCFAASDKEDTEGMDFNFYIDREKPKITKFEVRKKGEKAYLDVAATDNRYLMSISLRGKKGYRQYFEARPIKGLKETEYSFDITDMAEDTLRLEVMDYALNSETRSLRGLDISYNSFVSGTNTRSHLFNINNTTGNNVNASLILALYRNGALAAVCGQDASIVQGETFRVFDAPDVLYDSMKVFVWKTGEKMEPLYEAFTAR